MIWLLLLHNLSVTMCVFLLHKNEMQFFGHYLLILKLINIMYESKLSFSLHFLSTLFVIVELIVTGE